MLLGRNRAIGAIEIYSGADLATLKILHFDVCLILWRSAARSVPREVAILSPRSNWEAVVKSQVPTDFQSIPY